LVEQGTLNPKVEGSNPSRPILLLAPLRGAAGAAPLCFSARGARD
jgi:hypothetical protein